MPIYYTDYAKAMEKWREEQFENKRKTEEEIEQEELEEDERMQRKLDELRGKK